MKRKYITPNIEIIEFELDDIITHSMAMGDDESGNNDTSFDDFGGIWFDGYNANVNIGGVTYRS